jgi:hypothetical protein
MEKVQKPNNSERPAYLAYSSTPNTEATISSETSVDFQRTTRRYISEDRTLQNGNSVPVLN